MPRPLNPITGLRSGRLVAKEYLGKPGQFLWLCQCDCGRTALAKSSDMLSGKVKSCGCWNSDVTARRNYRHGGTKTPEYNVYLGMKRRCHDRRSSSYPDYGGRGIVVCEAWRESFPAFLADMGKRPSPAHKIERINNDGPYAPDNCRWALHQEQMRNRRSNRLVTYAGRTMSMAEAAEVAGVPYDVVCDRINRLKWTVERALAKKTLGRWV